MSEYGTVTASEVRRLARQDESAFTTDMPRDDDSIEIGQWYWVNSTDHDGNPGRWLGCVVHVGSNYANVQSPDGGDERILFDDFARCEIEPEISTVLAAKVQELRSESKAVLDEVRAITARLGVSPRTVEDNECRALTLATDQTPIDEYKTQLIVARDEALPALFKRLKKINESLACWLAADTLPLQAEAGTLNARIDVIKDRIHSVSLYAGLAEHVVNIKQGKTARMEDKLHIMQRMCFMDEECVAGYRHGGIDIRSLKAFDKWLAAPENFARLLPFPKCMVAFRVRRKEKHRDWDGTIRGIFLNFELRECDKQTFLYVRNGNRLSRLSTDIDFGERLFPDDTEFSAGGGQRMWARMFGSQPQEIITDGEMQEIIARREEKRRLWQEWVDANQGEHASHNPHGWHGPSIDYDRYQPFDTSSPYYDDICKLVADQVRDYNQISLIIQGLFDRSTILHPHPPVKLWTPDGVADAVVLVRDHDRALYGGEKPDFEAYRARCNETLEVGSVTVGQEDAWEIAEAAKECAKMDRDYSRNRDGWRPTRHRPPGDPGPGLLAKVAAWSAKARKAKYRWDRRIRSRYWDEHAATTAASIHVHAAALLNVDGYQPGDFHKFYDDPRTRAEYMKWANLLLAAGSATTKCCGAGSAHRADMSPPPRSTRLPEPRLRWLGFPASADSCRRGLRLLAAPDQAPAITQAAD